MTVDMGSFVLGFQLGIIVVGGIMVSLYLNRYWSKGPNKAKVESFNEKESSATVTNGLYANLIRLAAKEAVLTKEMQERGPIPDVPAVKWTNEAINHWLINQGFNVDRPILVFANPQNGNLLFRQIGAVS